MCHFKFICHKNECVFRFILQSHNKVQLLGVENADVFFGLQYMCTGFLCKVTQHNGGYHILDRCPGIKNNGGDDLI